MHDTLRARVQSAAGFVLALLFASAPGPGSGATDSGRKPADRLSESVTSRSVARYTLTIPSAGFVAIDVDVADPTSAQPWLELLEHQARPRGPVGEHLDLVVHHQTVSTLILEVRGPSEIVLGVATLAGLTPTDVTLRHAFIASNTDSLGDQHHGRISEKDQVDEDDEEIISSSADGPSGEHPLLDALDELMGKFCELDGTDDDHADSALCATPIEPGRPVTGRLADAVGRRDRDAFAFRLLRPSIVTLEASSTIEVMVALFDERGYLLSIDDDNGEGLGFRLTRYLLPGVYHLWLESAVGGIGTYTLSLSAN